MTIFGGSSSRATSRVVAAAGQARLLAAQNPARFASLMTILRGSKSIHTRLRAVWLRRGKPASAGEIKG
jgi:hypothetical protein